MTLTTSDDRAARAELIELLTKHRGLFLVTARNLSDEQARLTPTASTLSIGGLIKHVAATEAGWLDFVEHGPQDAGDVDWSDPDPAMIEAYQNGFRLLPDETLAGAIADYEAVAARTAALVESVDLDEAHDLPAAPWFEPGARWTNRRVFMHIAVETAQHAGHADIIRETIDGQKSMG